MNKRITTEQLARFEDSCRTGRAATRRLSCLGLSKLGVLTGDDGLWRDALRSVIALGVVHPDAQAAFLTTWTKVAVWSKVRARTGDDGLFFAAMRLLLPPYEGGPIRLFRGQAANDAVGMSWTRSEHIAETFALYGTAVPSEIRHAPARPGAVLLVATLRSEIICAPCLLGHREGEYIIDPRGVAPDRLRLAGEPAGASDPVGAAEHARASS
jgi:hypothetical protein